MIVELYRDPGQTNEIIPDVVKIEDSNNLILITDVNGTQWYVTNNVYYEIVATPDYS